MPFLIQRFSLDDYMIIRTLILSGSTIKLVAPGLTCREDVQVSYIIISIL